MMKMWKATIMAIIVVAITGIGLSGCGKKSPLSLPESSLVASQNSELSL